MFMRMVRVAVVLTLVFSSLTAATLEEARKLFEDRRLPQARASFEALSRSGPSRAEAFFYLGRIDMVGNANEKAAAHFEQAVKLEPANARYHFWLGRAWGAEAQKANPLRAASLARKVLHAFEQAARIDPSYIDAKMALIDFYLVAPKLMGGGEEKAKLQVAAIDKIDPAYGHLARARLHHQAKARDLAGAELEKAAARFSRDPRTHTWLSSHHAGSERWDAASRSAAEALRLDPAYMPANYHLGRAAAASGENLELGEAALKKYLAYIPRDDEPTITAAHYQLAMVYEKLGRKELATAHLKEAIRRFPSYEEAKKALARVGG